MTFDELRARLPDGPIGKDGPRLYSHVVTKFNKRLYVTRYETGERIYSPPDFIKIGSRADFAPMIEVLNRGARPIDAIIAFEAAARTTRDAHRRS